MALLGLSRNIDVSKLKFELFSLFRQTGFGCLSEVVVTRIFSLKLSELIITLYSE